MLCAAFASKKVKVPKIYWNYDKIFDLLLAICEKFPVICPICGKRGPSEAKLDNFPLSYHTLGRRMFYSSEEDDASSLASFSSVTTTTPDSLSESSKVSELLSVVNFLMHKLSSIPAFHNKSTFIRLDRLFVSSGGTINLCSSESLKSRDETT